VKGKVRPGAAVCWWQFRLLSARPRTGKETKYSEIVGGWGYLEFGAGREQGDLAVALHTCIWEVLGLNLSRDTGYPD
jgi:hypothetical protein